MALDGGRVATVRQETFERRRAVLGNFILE